jgi:CopG family nickel-responsive transcriptional regulator
MSQTIRFGVSLDGALLRQFDQYIVDRRYPSRSEAIRDLIRDRLVAREWEVGKQVVGTVTLVYNHHVPGLNARLTDLQHRFCGAIISTLHVHLDRENCLEVLIVRGKSREVRMLAERLQSVRGVKHSTFTMTTTGRTLR